MMRDRIWANRLGASMMAFVGYTAVMLVLERRMRQAGGAGIIPFELAGNASRAEAIMARWGSDGQRAARLSLWLDFGYMATYGTLMALLVERMRRRRGHPAAMPATVIVAVAGDALEGVSLLKVLNGTRVAALGACTSMTVRMYADRKGWPLERVRVTLRHSRIHAKDCADCETIKGLIDHIEREIELAGDLDDTQRQRLLQIAERCPVHQTLTSEVHIATSLR